MRRLLDRYRRAFTRAHAERPVDLGTFSALAWASWAFYVGACAWPAWECAAYWYPVACVAYGLLARRIGSAVCAGAAGACAGAPLLRIAADTHGLAPAVVGYLLAALVFAATVRGLDNIPARRAATLLWYACTAAGVAGLIFADAVAWVTW